MRLFQLLLTSGIILQSSHGNFHLTTHTSTNDYLYTTVSWGTPTQSFKVLVDTTDQTSWVYSSTVDTTYSTFDSDASTTYDDNTGIDPINFEYQGSTTEIDFAYDTLTLNGNAISDVEFALAQSVFNVSDDEGLSGFLSLDRDNSILSQMVSDGIIDSDTVTLDVGNNKVYFGSYSVSNDADTVSNTTYVASTTNDLLDTLWTFDIELWTDGQPRLDTQSIRGVIDSASPYVTVYSSSDPGISEIWKYIDNSYANTGGDYNCNYTTRECSTTDLWDSMTIIMTNSEYNITIESDSALNGDYIQFVYDNDSDYTADCDYVLFLGRPFLENVVVILDYATNSSNSSNSSATFSSSSSSSSSLDWEKIGIIAASVVGFAILFFALYCWKYGKIPPPTNNEVEEQQQLQELQQMPGRNSNANAAVNDNYSLLRGPAQAVGRSVNAQPVGSGGGLDDEQYQNELLQAERQSAIEEQQRRERQMREENERRIADEQRAMAAHSSQNSGSSGPQRLGGDRKPESAEELRAKRLRAMQGMQQEWYYIEEAVNL